MITSSIRGFQFGHAKCKTFIAMVRIAHLGDIHIQDRRRAEYAQVFSKLYESLRANQPDLIAVLGDVFDIKMHATPHNLEDVSAFLVALADIAPVVLIPGNHDVNTATPGALDLLSPLVKDHRLLQPPRLTFWRSSGTYAAHGIAWTVIAPDGGQPTADQERATISKLGLESAPHICLFHEEVNGAVFSNGMLLKDFKLTAENLSRYDLTLGAHIHVRQVFAPRAAYCGSLIQQNIGEAHNGHGYMLWDLDSSAGGVFPHRTPPPKAQGIDIPNPHGFVRIEISADGRDVTPRPIPEHPIYWELVHEDSTPDDVVEDFASEYATDFGKAARSVRVRGNGPSKPPEPVEKKKDEKEDRAEMVAAQTAARSLESHEPIIRDLLKDSAAEVVDEVIAMHKVRFQDPGYQAHLGARIRLTRIEFDNFQIYGPGNAIDLTQLEGCVSGIIANNGTGKSTLTEAIAFALYDVHERAELKENIIHSGTSSCHVVLEFELDGKPGRIEKTHSASKAQAGENRCRFIYAGEDRTQGGKDATVEEIRKVIGSKEDALATSIQMQDGDADNDFVKAGTAIKRKKLLASALSLGAFASIMKKVTGECTAIAGEIKALVEEYGKIPAEQLEYMRDVEEGDAADLRAEIAKLRSESNEARLAAQQYASAVGVAEAEEREALKVVKSRPVEDGPSEARCAEMLAAWETAIGPVANGELLEAASKTATGSTMPTSIPTKEQLEQGARILKQREAEADAANAEAEKKAKLCEGGTVSVAAAEAAVAEAERRVALVRDVAPPPEPTTERRSGCWPGCAAGVFGVRDGPRGSQADVEAALAILATPATVWPAHEPVSDQELANCRKMASISVAGPSLEDAQTALDSAKENYSTQLHQRTNAATKVRLLSEDRAHNTTAASPSLRECGLALEEAQGWIVAAEHSESFRKRLQPKPGCAGCSHALQLFDSCSSDKAREAVAAARQKYDSVLAAEVTASAAQLQKSQFALADAEAEKARAEALIVEAHRAAEARKVRDENAAKLVTLERNYEYSKLAESDQKERDRAISTLQIANYHCSQIQSEWAIYDKLRLEWEAGKSSRSALRELTAKALADAVEERARVCAQEATRLAAEAQYQEALLAAKSARERAKSAKHKVEVLMRNMRHSAIAEAQWWRDALKNAKERAADIEKEKAALLTAEQAKLKAEQARAAYNQAEARHKAIMVRQEAAQEKAAASAREAGRLTAELARESKRAEAHDAKLKQQAVLQAYKTVLSPNNGISDRLLERGRAMLVRRINEALIELGARFECDIELPKYNMTIRKLDGNRWQFPAKMNSGYEKFVLSLATRLAIWRLAASPRPDAMIIDEGFGTCDEHHLALMASALEALVSAPDGPKLVFVISHITALKAHIERELEIVVRPDGSHISNTTRTITTKSISKSAPASGLPADPNTPGNVYCETCKQSLRAAAAVRHLATVKHAKALKKREQ